jgi:hypothetical protein
MDGDTLPSGSEESGFDPVHESRDRQGEQDLQIGLAISASGDRERPGLKQGPTAAVAHLEDGGLLRSHPGPREGIEEQHGVARRGQDGPG